MNKNFLLNLKEKKNVVKLSIAALVGAMAVCGGAALCSVSATKGAVDIDGMRVERWSINYSENMSKMSDICKILEKGSLEDIEEYKRKAEFGDVLSMYALGSYYERGRRVAKDESQAFMWYVNAANSGLREALMAVARCYSQGIGVEKNLEEAHKYTKELAMSGEVQAMVHLAYDYVTGFGVDENEELAIQWYKRAGLSEDEIQERLQGHRDRAESGKKTESDSDME